MRASLALLAVIVAGVALGCIGWTIGEALGEAPGAAAGRPPMPGPAGCDAAGGCAEEVVFVLDLARALAGAGPGPGPDPLPPPPPPPPAPAFGPPPGAHFAALAPRARSEGPAPHPDRP